MDIREFYLMTATEAEYDDILRRMGGNEKLIKKFLGKLCTDSTVQNLMDALAKEDFPNVFTCAHNLKGVSLNLGLIKIAETSSEIVKELRANNNQVSDLCLQLKRNYDEIVALIMEIE